MDIQKIESQNSYECGKAGSRFKIYFDTPADLKAKIDELKKLGLWEVENEVD